jgi:hypothetical protein
LHRKTLKQHEQKIYPYTHLSKHRSYDFYKCTKLSYDHTELPYDHTELLYDHTELSYDRTELLYDRTELLYDHTNHYYPKNIYIHIYLNYNY